MDSRIAMSGRTPNFMSKADFAAQDAALQAAQSRNALSAQNVEKGQMEMDEYKAGAGKREQQSALDASNDKRQFMEQWMPHVNDDAALQKMRQEAVSIWGQEADDNMPASYDPVTFDTMRTRLGISSVSDREKFNQREDIEAAKQSRYEGLKGSQQTDYLAEAERIKAQNKASGKLEGEQEGRLSTGQQANPLKLDALKAVQESEELGNTSGEIVSNIDNYLEQIEGGVLTFGLVENQKNRLKNKTGNSDEQSRNLASFETGLEKMRNDSLRLNKGPQTDGDAERAFNELVRNINDKDVVRQRLNEIKALNEKAREWHANQALQIRQNFGNAPQQQQMEAPVNQQEIKAQRDSSRMSRGGQQQAGGANAPRQNPVNDYSENEVVINGGNRFQMQNGKMVFLGKVQ